MSETCAFCGGRPLTREHVWPSRFVKYLPKPPNPRFRHRREHGDETLSTHEHKRMDFTVRATCAACNNGWMQELDKEVEPIVAALMRGTSVSLDAASQELFARWALKIAYMAEFLHNAKRRTISAEYRKLVRAGTLPPDTYVYVAAYSGTQAGWNRLRTFHVTDKQSRVVGDGYLLTFIMGRLAIRVLGYPGATGERPNLSRKVAPWVRQLFPRLGEPFLDLPPQQPLRDEDVEKFTDQLPLPHVDPV